MTPLPSIPHKKAHTLCATLLLALLCGSCQQESNKMPQPDSNSWVMRLSLQPSAGTAEGEALAFEDGDQAGIFVVKRTGDSQPVLLPRGNYAHNVRLTYHGTWISDQSILWADDTAHADIYLYYPHVASMASPRHWEADIPTDQTTSDARRQANILAGSAIDIVPARDDIRIGVRHLMSRVVVKMKAGKGITGEQLGKAPLEVCLDNLATRVTVDIATATATTQGTARDDVRMGRTDSLTFTAYVAPQQVTGGKFITILYNGDRYTLSRTLTLQAGTSHTATVTLNKIDGNMGVSVTGWNTDPTDYGGAAE